MKCCCWAIPRRTCPSLRRYSCSQAAWRPNKPGMPPSSHETTCITWPRLPPSLSISPSPPGYATRRSAREVAMSPAPFYTLTAGDLTVTAVSDGLMSAPLSLLSGISREEAEHLQRHSGLASPETIAIGAYLIRGRGNTVLVDTGTAEPMALAANLSPIWRGSALVPRRSTPSFSPTPIRTISAACCPPLVRQRIPTPRCSCLRGKALTGWQHPRSTTPAIAAGATCCLFAVYWRTARRKSAGLMMRK